MPSIRRFLVVAVAFPLVLITAVAAGNLVFMARLRELWSADRVVEVWSRGNILFNPINIEDVRPRIVRALDPDVMVLGSSRSFNVHDYAFRRSFFNLGGWLTRSTAFDVGSFQAVPRKVLKYGRPRYLFFFLDYWWVMTSPEAKTQISSNESRQSLQQDIYERLPSAVRQILKASVLPSTFLSAGHLTLRQYFDVLRGRGGYADDIVRIGYVANLNEIGFGPDGAYYGLRLRAADQAGRICDLGDLSNRKRLPHGAYRPGQQLDPLKVAALKSMLTELEASSIRVIPILPPLAPSVVTRYQSDPDYAFVDEWRNTMKQMLPGVWDFHDSRALGSTDCEFHDDIHGGDVTYLRILERMGLESDEIRQLLNTGNITAAIRQFSGRRLVTGYGLLSRLAPLPVTHPPLPPQQRTQASSGQKWTHESVMADRLAANKDFLDGMPDYRKYIYDLLANIKKHSFQGYGVSLAAVGISLALLVSVGWFCLGILRRLPLAMPSAHMDEDLIQTARRQGMAFEALRRLRHRAILSSCLPPSHPSP
ncbi:hypothetical protein CU669_11075 [Paramagnetospirillum kuznetsovii]|uniref:Uncharacterized protein n=1 Tax=Paramagnetospirillum kuznetsovii TaxID=2053833 RepID=A0A364NXM2_9PROT|nr:hypothetical protein [Paramagnetospirillum kuznetsovii]RAU21841.1 hypothetical protein CU669_11075 [Paramagnetospirillum kuznetsovii]